VSASSSAQRLIPLVVGADSRHTIVQPSVGSRSDPSRRPIGVQVDAIQWPAGYGGFVRLRSLLGRHGLDALIIVLAAAAEVEVWLSDEQTPRIVTAPAALLWTLPLLFRRRFPLGAPVVVFAVLAAEAFLPGHAVTNSPVDGIALFAAFGLVATSADLRSAVGGAVIGYVALLLMVLVERPRFSDTWPVLIVAAATWVVGRALAERARRTATLAERANRLEREHEAAVTAERARIARELHDVIAHSVSVMTVQAGAARLLLDEDPARARAPLLSVEETGRQALAEMRRLLGILRADERPAALAPQPGVGDIAALAEQLRVAGLPVDVVVEGEPRALAPGIDLAAYRVVQEALTNALKHAGAARAAVSIRYSGTALELSVINDGHVPRNGRDGHGLVGMRERVALYGGEFEAGPRREGGYAVRATLPLEAPRA
jgi:signal transduction histidine kinase